MSQSQSPKRIALVTGANRGIGYEVCRNLLTKGLYVFLSARNEQNGTHAVRKLKSEGFVDVSFVHLDVTDQQSIHTAADLISDRHGRLDILINNAGILPDNEEPGKFKYNSILDSKIADVQHAWNTNTLGALRVCQSILPLMRRNKYGRIVNISSAAAQFKSMKMGLAGYRLSKVAVNALTRMIADEFHHENILCNAISPGWVKTEMGGPLATIDVEDAAESVIQLALLPDDGPTGTFFREGEPIDW